MIQPIKFSPLFEIGEVLYLVTDENQSKYMLTAYTVKPNEVLYEVYSHNNGPYIAYDFELSRERGMTV